MKHLLKEVPCNTKKIKHNGTIFYFLLSNYITLQKYNDPIMIYCSLKLYRYRNDRGPINEDR